MNDEFDDNELLLSLELFLVEPVPSTSNTHQTPLPTSTTIMMDLVSDPVSSKSNTQTPPTSPTTIMMDLASDPVPSSSPPLPTSTMVALLVLDPVPSKSNTQTPPPSTMKDLVSADTWPLSPLFSEQDWENQVQDVAGVENACLEDDMEGEIPPSFLNDDDERDQLVVSTPETTSKSANPATPPRQIRSAVRKSRTRKNECETNTVQSRKKAKCSSESLEGRGGGGKSQAPSEFIESLLWDAIETKFTAGQEVLKARDGRLYAAKNLMPVPDSDKPPYFFPVQPTIGYLDKTCSKAIPKPRYFSSYKFKPIKHYCELERARICRYKGSSRVNNEVWYVYRLKKIPEILFYVCVSILEQKNILKWSLEERESSVAGEDFLETLQNMEKNGFKFNSDPM